MQTEENKNSYEQRFHEERRIVKFWVFSLIGGVSVGRIADKILVSSGMTLAAGRNQVCPRDRRLRIGNRADLVGTVAIRTAGDAGKTQRGNLSMEGVPIRSQ